MRKKITSDIVEKLHDVPNFDLSDIDNVSELGIRAIKDFINHKEIAKECSIYGRFLIWLNNEEGIDLDCAEDQLKTFINEILEL